MNQIKIEKVVLSIGGKGETLERGAKLLELLSGQKAAKMKTKKRIATFGIRPKLEVGVVVSVRKNAEEFLKKFLAAKDNVLKKSQVTDNTLSFGIKEYIEIPKVEYQRDIGILGLDVSVTFTKPGKRVKLKKIKSGRFPKKQQVSKEEIIKFMQEKFNTKFI
ncbi:MAG: hypothetical protein KatS3mg001_270 [Candidatus Pacearchaeota archaeon]|nr:MAG: hypothetical protein KatS3mg001_270 [Candidatus Pacearchaeota archaeon]